MLHLKLFGQFEIAGPEGRIGLSSAKLSAFLAYLAMARKPVPREQLTTLLWGSHFEDQARQNFRQALARLRKAIGPEALISDDQTVQLSPSAVASDARQFESLAGRESADELRQAVDLLDGDLLAGIDVKESPWEDWLSEERRRIGNLACGVLVRLGRIELERGKTADALQRAEACIRRDIFREDAHRLAIQAFVVLGRRAEALKHYQSLAERLKQELGTPPEAETIRIYEQARANAGVRDEAPSPAPVRKPSIAVLPFANLSNDPEQDYFADGMVDEIITGLSRMHWLFVIARNSSFTYKGRAVDVTQVGRELGVRYVLEGSVRKAGNRLRIGGQLIDAATGAALWADRIEGELKDVFELQDMVTAKVVGAISPKLEQAEIERSKRKPTGSLDAYDYYLRGLAEVPKWTREGNEQALAHFYRAIELDPEFASAYGMAARCYSQRKAGGWISDHPFAIAEVQRLARRALELGQDDSVALSAAGMALAFVAGELETGDALIGKGLELNPNLASAWMFSGWVKAWSGEADTAISHITRAMHLSPHDPSISNMRWAIAFSYFIAGRYREALSVSESVTAAPQNGVFAMATAAASAAFLGRMEEAESAVSQLRAIDPTLRLANLRQRFPIKREEDFARWTEGLKKAGLPE
ncbi:MAG: adenylate cyclase [Rhizobiales bacterium]|nr:adenylate cyclase [Hyphomicrobiales bacterium]